MKPISLKSVNMEYRQTGLLTPDLTHNAGLAK
jgi:hypothetical protein